MIEKKYNTTTSDLSGNDILEIKIEALEEKASKLEKRVRNLIEDQFELNLRLSNLTWKLIISLIFNVILVFLVFF